MKSIALNTKTTEDLLNQIREQLANGIKPTMSIIFCNPDHDVQQIIDFHKVNNIQLIGCTTAGEICTDDKYENHAVAMLMEAQIDAFRIVENSYNSEKPEIQVITEFTEMAASTFKAPSLIFFASGIKRNHGNIVEGIKQSLPASTQVYGGCAGDDGHFKNTISFTDNGIINDGFVSLVLDSEKIEVQGIAISGWTGMGNNNVITKAKDNVIYEINDQPALDFFLKHFGLNDFYNNGASNTMVMPGNYPLEMVNKNGFQRLRSIMNYDREEGGLVLAGTVEEGEIFRFCLPPSIDVLDQSIQNFYEFSKSNKEADAVFLISCMARKQVFGPLITHEISGIQKIWNKPLIGFFAYGEIGKINTESHCDFHNCTSNLFIFKEVVK